MKKIVSITIAIVMLLSLSGCSMFDFFSIENLLKPPKLAGEQSGLQAAFEKSVGTDISLFTPLAGEYRAAYIIFDVNSDGNDEAIVFYSLNSNSSVVHMHLLSQLNGEWYSVDDITGSGTDVYKVDFFNIDSNRNLEIGVIWTLDDSKRDKNLSVYRVSSLDKGNDDAVISLATIQIFDYVYSDVDGDTAHELLYFYFVGNSENAVVNARLIDYDSLENNMVPLSEVTLPFVFSSINQILIDVEDNNMRFYLDFSSSTGAYFSEMLIYSRENAALFIPLLNGKNISALSIRSTQTVCSDFNNDGYYDIPLTLMYEESYAVSDIDSAYTELTFVHWYTYFDGNFKSIGRYFVNYYDNYSLNIDSIYDNFYIVYDIVNSITQVRLKNSGEENIVFSVACKDKSDDSVSLLPEGFLGTDGHYTVIISAGGEAMSFTESYIKSLISEF